MRARLQLQLAAPPRLLGFSPRIAALPPRPADPTHTARRDACAAGPWRRFDGIPVAKLPFEPFGIFTPVSHRGLAGEDYTQCSCAFLYTLCAMSIRPNLQKALGFGPPTSVRARACSSSA
jgi:hypothetical protein